jgi:hypothetical protein
VPRLRILGAITPLPNTPSWRDSQLKVIVIILVKIYFSLQYMNVKVNEI